MNCIPLSDNEGCCSPSCENLLYENLHNGCSLSSSHGKNLYPFSEIVHYNQKILILAGALGKWSHDVHPKQISRLDYGHTL